MKADMPRSRRLRQQIVTVTALGALAVVAVLAVTPVGPWVLRSKAAPRSASMVTQYTCDLAAYGYKGPPVTMDASADASATATAVAVTGFSGLFGSSGPASFSTSAATLPASVAARLGNLSSLTLSATVPVFGSSAASPEAKIFGTTQDSALPTGRLTQLQVNDAFDTAFFSSPGTAWLEFPARTLVFTPYRHDRALPTITCQAVTGPLPPSEVTVIAKPVAVSTATSASGALSGTAIGSPAAAAPAPAANPTSTAGGAAGQDATGQDITGGVSLASQAPAYACTSSVRTPTYRSPLPMTLTVAGTPIVGNTLTVTLSSPATGLAAPAPGQATGLAFAGSLPVTGAQPGAVALSELTADADNPTFTVSGQLALLRAGTDVISVPRRFDYTVYLHGNRKAVFGCTLTSSGASVGGTSGTSGTAGASIGSTLTVTVAP